MATLLATIPDDLQRIAKARGVTVQLLVEQALRFIVAPEPFEDEVQAEAEMDALQADVLKDLPWQEWPAGT